MLFEPVLDLQDDHILMQLLSAEANAAGGIAALHFIQDVTGHGLGHVGAAETLDQIDIEVAG
ncbi:hypothetical protein D3C75_1362230 [compost metagenome]